MNRFADVNDVQELMGQMIGAASTCWENLSSAGVFDSTKAKAILDEAVERLQQITPGTGVDYEKDRADNDLYQELTRLINQRCRENRSGTPDFILGKYLLDCLRAFEWAVNRREGWFGRVQDEFGMPTGNISLKDG